MRYPEVSRRFHEILALRKMKARDLAERAGMTEAAVSHYVNGNRCPTNKSAVRLANVLNCNPIWLMDLDDDRDRGTFQKVDSVTYKIDLEENSRIVKIMEEIDNIPEPQQEHFLNTVESMLNMLKGDDKKEA